MRARRSVFLGAAVIGVLIFGSAQSAAAHDELVGSDPASGEVRQSLPESVELTFSGELMELGAIVEVRDAGGVDHAAGDPEIDGTVVTVPVDPGGGDGSYAVVWRVVSSDGHPISGSVPFVVGSPSPERTDTPSATPTPTAVDAEATDAAPPASSAWAPGGWARTAAVAAGGATLALLLLIVGITLGRRRAAADRATGIRSGAPAESAKRASAPAPHEKDRS
ncbi:copper resistance CopC family protein [Microbacterium lacus]|uniref:CopC domain-containing protein n=1 Tax=Microbacterium lacus TaxID=415217 RepID=A0ABP4S7H2_9MICO